MRFVDTVLLREARVSGSVVMRVAFDSLGHVDQSQITVHKSSDASLRDLAIELARGVVIDSQVALRLSGRAMVDLPFVFLVYESDTLVPRFEATVDGASALVYIVFRGDTGTPPVVEALAALLERIGGPPPDYPSDLMRRGIEGSVLVEGVVDTLGRVERNSTHVVFSTNPGFNYSAERTILLSRFKPARTPWHVIRVRVRLPVTYTIRH